MSRKELLLVYYCPPHSGKCLAACARVSSFPLAAGRERPLLDSPRDFEEGLDGMHLRQWGVSVGQLDGGDAQRPNITAGVVRVVILLLAGDHLCTDTQTEAVSASDCDGFCTLFSCVFTHLLYFSLSHII